MKTNGIEGSTCSRRSKAIPINFDGDNNEPWINYGFVEAVSSSGKTGISLATLREYEKQEVIYEEATWRMYDRIMDYRSKQQQQQQQQSQCSYNNMNNHRIIAETAAVTAAHQQEEPTQASSSFSPTSVYQFRSSSNNNKKKKETNNSPAANNNNNNNIVRFIPADQIGPWLDKLAAVQQQQQQKQQRDSDAAVLVEDEMFHLEI